MARRTTETPGGGLLRDGYGRRELVSVVPDTPPSAGEVRGVGTVFDADGREQVVLYTPAGVTLESESVTYPPQQVDSMGHSYMAGAGVPDPRNRFTAKFSRLINSAEANRGVSGSLLSSHANGGWQSALQNWLGSTTDVKYMADRQCGVILTGINDLNAYGSAGLAGVRNSLRTVVARLRSGFVWEDNDASVAYSGADWTAVTAATENSGATHRTTTVNGATYTITTPADFPGGTVGIGMTARFGGQGARHTFTLNGAAAGFIDAYNAQASGYIGCVYRIKNVPAGVNTIVGTVSGIVTITNFDYWQYDASPAPTVLVCLQPYLVDYSAYGAGSGFGPPTDAGIDALNTVFTDVAAEFDSSVVAVSFPAMYRQASYFQADKLHPNEKGHAYIADQLVRAWRAAPFKLGAAMAPQKAGLRLPDGGLFATNGNSGTIAWTPGAIGAAGNVSKNVTIAGAVAGDVCAAGYSQVLTPGLILTAQVTATDTVTCNIYNATAGSLTPAAGTVRASVLKPATNKLAVLDAAGAITGYIESIPTVN
jgi:hypothetical protein